MNAAIGVPGHVAVAVVGVARGARLAVDLHVGLGSAHFYIVDIVI